MAAVRPARVACAVCENFEPQAWRKTMCKNCFHALQEHAARAAAAEASAAASSVAAEASPTPIITTDILTTADADDITSEATFDISISYETDGATMNDDVSFSFDTVSSTGDIDNDSDELVATFDVVEDASVDISYGDVTEISQVTDISATMGHGATDSTTTQTQFDISQDVESSRIDTTKTDGLLPATSKQSVMQNAKSRGISKFGNAAGKNCDGVGSPLKRSSTIPGDSRVIAGKSTRDSEMSNISRGGKSVEIDDKKFPKTSLRSPFGAGKVPKTVFSKRVDLRPQTASVSSEEDETNGKPSTKRRDLSKKDETSKDTKKSDIGLRTRRNSNSSSGTNSDGTPERKVPKTRVGVAATAKSKPSTPPLPRSTSRDGKPAKGPSSPKASLKSNKQRDIEMAALEVKCEEMEKRCEELQKENAELIESVKQHTERDQENKDSIDSLQIQVELLNIRTKELDDVNRELNKTKEIEKKLRKLSETTDTELKHLHHVVEDQAHETERVKDDNADLQLEIRETRQEMEEMYDQFRESEVNEFRDLQKELEITSKNYRLLQFKLRKSERKNSQTEKDRQHYEFKIKELQNLFEDQDAKTYIMTLEEDLSRAKSETVHVHDELDMAEEKRMRLDDENRKLQEILEKTDKKQFRMEMEIDKLHDQIDDLRSQLRECPEISDEDQPRRKKFEVTLVSAPPKQGSFDMEQSAVVKDLYDSLERENDIKDQLKFAEDEAKNASRKCAELEEENENLNMQLRKVSAAKMSKPSTPDDDLKSMGSELAGAGSYSDLSNETELRMKVELDLVEQEASGLRRRLGDLERDNDELIGQVKGLEKKLEDRAEYLASIPPPSPKSYYEDKIKEMTMELDEVRWKVIEKDREIDRLNAIKRDSRSGSGGIREGRFTPPLSKSKSLDGDPQVIGLKKQIDESKQTADAFRNKITSLEKQVVELSKNKRELERQKCGAVTADIPPAVGTPQNTQQISLLKNQIKVLVGERTTLTGRLRNVTDGLASLTRDVASMDCINCKLPTENFNWTKKSLSRKLSKESEEQLKVTTKELAITKSKMADLQTENSRLVRDITRLKEDAHDLADQSDSKPDDEKTEEQLRNTLKDYKDEIQELLLLIRSREDKNEELEAEVKTLRKRVTRLQDEARKAELELLEELEMSQQKNDVLSNLLEIVSDRANANEQELQRITNEQKSERSASEVSALSHTSTGSDDVFQGARLGEVVERDWDQQMKKRLGCLERLLAEEKQKVSAAEKRLILTSEDRLSTAMSDDVKLRMREKELLQNELSESQKHLIIAGDQIRGLRDRVRALEECNIKLMNDYVSLESEFEWPDVTASKDCDSDNDKLQTKIDELTQENIKLKNEKEAVSDRMHNLNADLDSYKRKAHELHYKVEEINEIWVSKSRASEREKEELDVKVKDLEIKLWKVTEALQKTTMDGKQKAAVIAQTDKLMAEKDDVIKKRESIIKQQEHLMKQRDSDFESLIGQMSQRESHIRELTARVNDDGGSGSVSVEVYKELLQTLSDRDAEITELNSRLQHDVTPLVPDVRESGTLKQWIDQQNTAREKVEKERDRLSSELCGLRDEINQKETNWKMEQSNVLTALKIFKEKYGTLESMARTSDNEMLIKLNESNGVLITEKETLAGEIRKLQIRLEQVSAEKVKMAEDSRYLGEKMVDEVNRLKTQAQLSFNLQDEERVLRAELVAMRATYESRIDTITHDYNAVRAQAEALQKERDLHQDIIKGIQKGMGQLKVKYTHELASWQQEKLGFERKVKDMENGQILLAKMAAVTEDLNVKLYEESQHKIDMENELISQRTIWDMERADWQSRVNQLEERLRCHGGLNSDSDVVAAWQDERTEQKRLVNEAHRLSMDLQRQLKSRDESHSRERRDIARKFDDEKRALENTRNELETRLAMIEAQAESAASLQVKISDVESRQEADRHMWQTERQTLHGRLGDAREVLVKQNNKIDQVLHLLKRLRELAAMVTDVGQSGNQATECMDSETIQKSLDQAVINYIRESMSQLHAVTEDLSQYVDITSSLLPPMKRSASSTLVEISSQGESKVDTRLLHEPSRLPPIPRSADSSPTRGRDVTPRRHSGGVSPSTAGLPPLYPTASKPTPTTKTVNISRSVSPDANRQRVGGGMSPVKKLTRYPDPPPSFIISPPPMTPQTQVKSQQNVSSKTPPIPSTSPTHTQPQPVTSQKPIASRQLTKSVSFDTAFLMSQQEQPAKLVSFAAVNTGGSGRSRRDSSDEIGRGKTRRSGQSLDRNALFLSPRCAGSLDRLSPRSARRKFFLDFHDLKSSVGDLAWWKKKTTPSHNNSDKNDQYAVPNRGDHVFSSVQFHRDTVSPVPDVTWTERVNIVDNSGADIYENVTPQPIPVSSASSQISVTSADAKTSLPVTKDKRKLFKNPFPVSKSSHPFGSDLLAAVKRRLRPTNKKSPNSSDASVASADSAPASDVTTPLSEGTAEIGDVDSGSLRSSLEALDSTAAFPLYEDITPMTPFSFAQVEDGSASPNINKPPAPPSRQPPRRWRSRSAERVAQLTPDKGQGHGQGHGKPSVHADVVSSARIWQFNETPV